MSPGLGELNVGPWNVATSKTPERSRPSIQKCDLDNSKTSFERICDIQAPWYVYSFILVIDETGGLFHVLFVVSLNTQVQQVGRNTGQTSCNKKVFRQFPCFDLANRLSQVFSRVSVVPLNFYQLQVVLVGMPPPRYPTVHETCLGNLERSNRLSEQHSKQGRNKPGSAQLRRGR